MIEQAVNKAMKLTCPSMKDTMIKVRSKVGRACLFFNLAALLLNLSLLMLRINMNPVMSGFYSGESLSKAERLLMMSTFATLVETFDAANVTYFMYGGTLIGSVRHHGMIPWDDDLDIMISATNRSTVRSILTKMGPEFNLYTPSEEQKRILQWKFYPTDGLQTSWLPESYRWPFVDIFFFEENATHIWDLEPEYHASGFVWPKSSVFPLARRPFGNLAVPAPCDALSFVLANYANADTEACSSRSYDHRLERHLWHQSSTVHCSHLWHIFPFVFRSKAADGRTVETLKIGNWSLQSFTADTGVCSG